MAPQAPLLPTDQRFEVPNYGSIYQPKAPVCRVHGELLPGGALRPGGAPSVFSRSHIGLLAHIASVGVIYGVNVGVIYSVLNNYLYMSATLVATAQALVRIPRSLRMFAAVFTDCYPIFGYRRRPYLVIGWALTFFSCFLMAVLPLGKPYYTDSSVAHVSISKMTDEQLQTINFDAPTSGIKLIFLFMLANLGTVIAFGASDGYMVELSQREPEDVRGSVQLTLAVVRHSFAVLSAFMTGFGLNSVDYGGTFTWSMGFNNIMWVCTAFAFVTIPLCWFCISEEKTERKSMRKFFGELLELMQHRVFYQIIAFRFFRQIFSLFRVTASTIIKSTYAKVEPLNDGIATMLSALVAVVSLCIIRRWGLHWSWQVVVVACQFVVVLLDAIPTLLTIWNVYRSQWFWLGMPLIEEFPTSIGDFIATLFVVEICEPGREATIMGLMVTITALGTPFATVLYKSVDSYFDIERRFVDKDDPYVHSQLTYAYLIAYALNIFSVVFVVWLPRQKAEARELKRAGQKNKLLGNLTVAYLIFAFAWTVMTNILSLFKSTRCMRIAGGSGCS